MHPKTLMLCGLMACCLVLCAGTAQTAGLEGATHEQDRRAILSMAGTYEISSRFEEIIACAAEYELEEVYNERTAEVVIVVEDSPERISLQHVMVVGHDSDDPFIVKHWRHDWIYEDPVQLVFRGHSLFVHVDADPAQVAGTWTQAVYHVGDAPRYEGRGRWQHLGETSTWESKETWQPLPRRQRHREDYHLIAGRHRVTITPTGWSHEQYSRKLVLSEVGVVGEVVAHELGLNSYRRCDPAELEIGLAYWEGTADFWAEVRDTWDEALSTPGTYRIQGIRTINTLAELADECMGGEWRDADQRRARLRELVHGSVELSGASTEASSTGKGIREGR